MSVTVFGTAPTQDLVIPLKTADGTTTAAGSPGAEAIMTIADDD